MKLEEPRDIFGRKIQQTLATILHGIDNVNSIKYMLRDDCGIDAETKAAEFGFESFTDLLESEVMENFVTICKATDGRTIYRAKRDASTARIQDEQLTFHRHKEKTEEQKQRRILRDFGAQPISQPQQQPLQSNIAMSSFRNNLGQSTMEPAFRESQPSGYARSQNRSAYEERQQQYPQYRRQQYPPLTGVEMNGALPANGWEDDVPPDYQNFYRTQPKRNEYQRSNSNNSNNDKPNPQQRQLSNNSNFNSVVAPALSTYSSSSLETSNMPSEAVERVEDWTSDNEGTGKGQQQQNPGIQQANLLQTSSTSTSTIGTKLPPMQARQIEKQPAPKFKWSEGEGSDDEQLIQTSSNWRSISPFSVTSASTLQFSQGMIKSADVNLISLENSDDEADQKQKKPISQASSSNKTLKPHAFGTFAKSPKKQKAVSNKQLLWSSSSDEPSAGMSEAKLVDLGRLITDTCRYYTVRREPLIKFTTLKAAIVPIEPAFEDMVHNGTLVDFLKHYCPELRLFMEPPEYELNKFYLMWDKKNQGNAGE